MATARLGSLQTIPPEINRNRHSRTPRDIHRRPRGRAIRREQQFRQLRQFPQPARALWHLEQPPPLGRSLASHPRRTRLQALLQRALGGHARIWLALGLRRKLGRHSPIITAVGSSIRATAGSGFPAMSGRRPGSCGVRAAAISAGFRCRPTTIIMATAPIATISTISTAIAIGTDRVLATTSSCRSGSLSARIISATGISATMRCRSAITAASSRRPEIRPTTSRSTITSSIAASTRAASSKRRISSFQPVPASSVIGRNAVVTQAAVGRQVEQRERQQRPIPVNINPAEQRGGANSNANAQAPNQQRPRFFFLPFATPGPGPNGLGQPGPQTERGAAVGPATPAGPATDTSRQNGRSQASINPAERRGGGNSNSNAQRQNPNQAPQGLEAARVTAGPTRMARRNRTCNYPARGAPVSSAPPPKDNAAPQDLVECRIVARDGGGSALAGLQATPQSGGKHRGPGKFREPSAAYNHHAEDARESATGMLVRRVCLGVALLFARGRGTTHDSNPSTGRNRNGTGGHGSLARSISACGQIPPLRPQPPIARHSINRHFGKPRKYIATPVISVPRRGQN